MEKLYITQWHGIEFSEFTQYDNNSIADYKFYNKFYDAFFEKYSSFDDLSPQWVESRKNSIKLLLTNLNNCKKVLSIGCGIGYLEKEVALKFDGDIIAIEPSFKSLKWIKSNEKVNVIEGFFPTDMPDNINPMEIDLAYIASIDYIFTDDEYISFLKNILNYGIKELLIVDVGLIADTKNKIKGLIRNILAFLGVKKYKNDNGQWIGYRRTFQEQYTLVKQAGFKRVEHGFFNNDIPYIKAYKEDI